MQQPVLWTRLTGKDRRNWLIMGFAGWEFATLSMPQERHAWLPVWWQPWTRYFWRWRAHPIKRVGLWLLLGWLVEHIWGENRCVHHPGGCPAGAACDPM